ncbi:transmembrane channel-like protein 5 isoform X1 [Phyllopteryx taeniolatus]|uniref:transmembrane channel-like protein 5 isoform X1 n=2 Tax=Phyllopteryx taeniolatus TaxID=161469 RepID=UPI002AD438CD|nr:transmembrane channel-like protein 5 isoform X1 [Phyllopteryx taeniolatus]XP_061625740.1 transmembrane channel-like protein 5 isoform X1 [Phyllopteryx taeniolatus]XP_061625741.1 transmembrane channel-like protein 5 isoform X1 [Phyllopteryx taeniolatus]XP_061625742.1 transmembrane channel-like protein 5 isoform X1 [Phyllopteryx taeniolatus]
MSSYSNGGLLNPAYHESETLEIDRPSRKQQHTNPYVQEEQDWWKDREETYDTEIGQSSGNDAVVRVPWGGGQEEGWRGRESIPMRLQSRHPESSVFQHDFNQSPFQINRDSPYDQFPPIRLPSASSGTMSMRCRGAGLRMSVFPSDDPRYLAFTEEAIKNEVENEEQRLVKELVGLSTRDRIKAIRDLPMSFEEKKHIRSEVLAFESGSRQFTCFADCSERASLFLRRCGYSIRSARQTSELWQGIMKEIGGKFGTSVLTYFLFLKWLLMFNIFSFLVNFGFITIPLLVYDISPNLPPNVGFRGLEILTGAGYFNYSVMYYGGYSNETLVDLVEYNMQLAYFFTIAVYMTLCGIALITSMANSFKTNYVLVDQISNSAWQLLCSWDFSIINERAVRQRKTNLRVQLKESMSEKAQRDLLTLTEKLKHIGLHLGLWLLSTSLAVGCAASIYFLCQYEHQNTTNASNRSLLQEAETLLVPFVVSLMNLVVPLFYSLFNKFEQYSSQRRQIYALLLRNVLLKMLILGVLCYYWMNVVAQKFSCWESMVGQALYRLVIFDFLFLMLGSFFGEFLSNLIGTKFLPRLGVPEFDVARNVLELIYAQTIVWIGIYFSPLLPAIQIVKCLILFFVKKVSLNHNCQPPRRTGRAAQMQTIFTALLFFPFFVGALSMVAYTTWRLTPSQQCGPFRGLNSTFSVVEVWIDDLQDIPGSQGAIWIYENVIRSEIVWFLGTLIILIIIYIFWQVSQGRKHLIGRLIQQIVNEGKDKSFLLEKLQNLQKSHPNKKHKQKSQKKHPKQRLDNSSTGGKFHSNNTVQALIVRQQLEQEERCLPSGMPLPSDISTSEAVVQTMKTCQRAEEYVEELYPMRRSSFTLGMPARHVGEHDGRDVYYSTAEFPDNVHDGAMAVIQARQARQKQDDDAAQQIDDLPSPFSNAMTLVMQARQRAERDEGLHWGSAPPQKPPPASSSALIQAMLARQQAQNEYDDGY